MNASSMKKQCGMMLLEALVGLLIFSIGILGLVGLQATSIQNSAAATYRTEASYLANQMIGTMWTDKDNLASYALNSGNNGCALGASNGGNDNVINWLKNDVARLPGNTAAASGVQGYQQKIEIAAGNQVTVTVCWKSPKDIGPHNFIAKAQIN